MRYSALYPLCLGLLATAIPLGGVVARAPLSRSVAASPALVPAAGTPPPVVTPSPDRPDQTVLINFSIVPANQQPPQRLFRYTVAPGASLSDRAAILNPNSAPLVLTLSSSDAINDPLGGGITFIDDTRKERALGQWFHVDAAGVVTVPPKSALLVPVSLHVPSTARPGQYVGGLNGTTVQMSHGPKGKVVIKARGRVRCYVTMRVTGPATAGLAIAAVRVDYVQHDTFLNVTLRNTGTTIIDGAVAQMTFTTSSVLRPYTLQRTIGTLLAGNSATFPLLIDGRVHQRFVKPVPPGAYRMSLKIVSRVKLSHDSAPRIMQRTWSGPLTIPDDQGR
jgi:hypothetical protein